MKKITILFFFIICATQLYAQPTQALWASEEVNYETRNVVTLNGIVYVTIGPSNSGSSRVIAYNSSDGTTIFNTELSSFSYPIGLANDSQGQFLYVTGSSASSNELLLTKINATTGAIVWTNNEAITNGAGFGWSTGVAVDSQDNVITINYEGNDTYYRVIKHDENGVILWDTTFNISGGFTIPRAIAIDNQDKIIVAGQGSSTTFHLLSINPDQSLNWRIDDEVTSDNSPTSVMVTNDNSIVVTGTNGYNTLQYARKYDNSGNLFWNFTENPQDGPTTSFGVTQDSEGNILLFGGYDENAQFDFKLSIRALNDTDGSLLWTFVDTNLNYGSVDVTDITTLDNGNIAVTGSFQHSPAQYTGYTILYEYDASLSMNDYNENSYSVFPNPAKNSLNIKANQFVETSKYQITNMLGQVIKTGKLNALNNNIDVSDISKGNYILTILSEGNKSIYSKKIVLSY